MKYPPLEPEKTYHIFNRGINGESIFKEERNYSFFLRRYADFMVPVIDTFAYCLLRNHFHLLIRVRSEDALKQLITVEGNPKEKTGLHSGEQIASKQFAKFFSSYSQSVNKATGRTGALIETPFERKEVTHEGYFTRLVWYIHTNPQKHKLVSDFRNYPHSSYRSHLSNKPTQLAREEVIQWFGGINEYVDFHQLEHRSDDLSDSFQL